MFPTGCAEKPPDPVTRPVAGSALAFWFLFFLMGHIWRGTKGRETELQAEQILLAGRPQSQTHIFQGRPLFMYHVS